MHVLNEKYLLKWASKGMIPPRISRRPKQPYRAPESDSFFATKLSYVEELLQPRRLQEDGIFRPPAVAWLLEKIRNGRPLSTKDNMALVGIIATQLWMDQFIRNSSGRLTYAQM
jgi:asparagine synthase (glutamine-hydrolysing)